MQGESGYSGREAVDHAKVGWGFQGKAVNELQCMKLLIVSKKISGEP